MPKDRRLWMTFPIDFHRHRKITRLPIEVRWAFVEMNGEARIANNDGVFPADEAEFEWGKDVLDQLVDSHPTRPLVLREGDTYRIRDYAEHQITKAEQERRAEISRSNGAKGGRPRKNPDETQEEPNQVSKKPGSNPDESRVKSPEVSTYVNESTHVSRRAREEPDSNEESVRVISIRGLGVEVERFQNAIRRKVGVPISVDGAARVATHLLSKPRKSADDAMAYVMGCVNQSAPEIQKYIHEEGLS